MSRFLSIEIYRGDTFENFLKCAVPNSEGRVYLDRVRNPFYNFDGTCTSRKSRGVADPFSYALREALERGETPAIFAGDYPFFSKPVLRSYATGQFILLHEGKNMPVDKIWLPKSDFDWSNIDLQHKPEWLRTNNNEEIWKRLELKDPRTLLTTSH